MKATWAVLAMIFGVAASSIWAQESLSEEDALKGARVMAEKLSDVADAPLKVTPDIEKPSGLRTDNIRLLVVPDKALTAEKLAKADNDIVPIGHLYTLFVTLVANDKPVADDKLRDVPVESDGKTYHVYVHYLGVRKTEKNGKDALELVVLTRGKEPVVKAPLEKSESNQAWPLEVSGRKGTEDRGILTLNILGKYRTELTVAPCND